MASLAAVFVALVKIPVVFVHPARIVDIVQPMRAVGGQGQAALAVTGAALDDGSGMSLKLSGRDVVVGRRVFVGPDGVGTAMAAFAGKVAVALAESKESVGVFRKAFVGCQEGRSRRVIGFIGLSQAEGPISVSHQTGALEIGNGITGVAGLAAGQVFPGSPRSAIVGAVDAAAGQQGVGAADRRHAAVAVEAAHPAGGHGPALTLGDVTGMALVAAGIYCGGRLKNRQLSMILVHHD